MNIFSNKISVKPLGAMLMLCVLLVIEVLPLSAQTSDPLQNIFSSEPNFLPVESAFVFDFKQENSKLIIDWHIAEGYYLYKKQFKTTTKNADIGEATFGPSVEIEDEFFGISEVFYNSTTIVYPINSAKQDGVVKLRFQGCASAGLCYPPTTQIIYLTQVGNHTDDSTDGNSSLKNENTNNSKNETGSSISEQFSIADTLKNNENMLITLGVFVLFGLGLAFTPCVFPMYPILSSIVLGRSKALPLSKAFILSFVYVQGMAITYSILGLIVASAGVQFQAALQHPVILYTLIVLFVLLAVAMFGAYQIQLPAKWQEKLNSLSNTQKQGSYVGVFIMGVISGLVASPCTTAPLTGILLFVAQSGDLLLGFSALYALSLGMGIPLILFGMTGGKLLPKAGNWMNVVKASFGFMMLAVAIMFVERVIVAEWTWLLWYALGACLFTYWFVVNQDTKTSLFKGVRTLIVLSGLIISVLSFYNHISANLNSNITEHTNTQSSVSTAHPDFVVVKNIEDFYGKLEQASSEGKSVMVDLYADWCIACKEFEKYTFPDPLVVAALSNTVWMQIDLTDNTPTNLAFQEHFEILGLPTILLFDQNGYELRQSRVTGFMKAQAFAQHVNTAFQLK